ncbi:dihydroneopterin aldolase [Sphingomonadaceae bacterium G21617-S1]|jgi:7,8-dihydroneopterin aldolase/epimerase/oxygenase|nr:dihydroneopterin aldolase [Sphingomonadaceae bacterium G21617-S1]
MPKERPMLTTIQIAGLQTYGYHGLFEEERSLGQKFIFDIEAELQPVETHRDDRLDSSVRYDAVADTVVQLAGAAQYQTLETLAEAVAIGLLEQFAAIDTIAVAVSKFSPPVAHTLERLGVKIALERRNLPCAAPIRRDLAQA